MSQEEKNPLSPSSHHSDSVPNIFAQINEYAKMENLAIKSYPQQNSAKKPVDGNAIRMSVISNLQHALNLSNVGAARLASTPSKLNVEPNCWQKPLMHVSDTDHENNQIMSEGSLGDNPDDCDVPAKKPKLSETVVLENELYCKLYKNDRLTDMRAFRQTHRENLTELFFLVNGGNLMDYFSWKKMPNNRLACYLFSEKLDTDDEDHEMEVSRTESCSVSSPAVLGQSLQHVLDLQSSSQTAGSTFTSPFSDEAFPTDGQSNSNFMLIPTSRTSRPKFSAGSLNANFANSAVASLASVNVDSPLSSASSSSSMAAVSAANETAQEAIAELARQEAQVMEKITELRKKGLWSVRRIPKAAEPVHARAHWDYVMEEMQWLAQDFFQERKGKKAGSRKIGRMVIRHFQDQQQRELKAEKEDALKLKRIASNMSKFVKEFWSNIEKVVQYKQQSRLDEKRKKALDMHLSFIVDQTEKYSTWLTEGLGASLSGAGQTSQLVEPGSPVASESNADEDFKPNQNSSDDEETIEKEEQDLDEDKTAEEVAALQKEGEMSFEEFLQTLPKEVLNSASGVTVDKPESDTEEDEDDTIPSDADSYLPSEDDADDEETLEVEEKMEECVDHSEELSDLQKEGEMPIEELLKMYQSMNENEQCVADDEEEVEDDQTSSSHEAKEGGAVNDNDKDSEVGTEFLIQSEKAPPPKDEDSDKSGPGREISDIAAAALSIQPTGYTLETAHVKTAVPFLVKHNLREYQHVGLDWLATMYEQRLNGILADEMGLGKTIQTIALLGFLACERGIWGPHLIVVPTSVMLNWEMEFKKWCPAFKILTYYGNLKERKAKRQGWTKTNAFHVCITSYKLVIQDHQAFRRKKWKYFILDEAQNIKNFKSQRWQTLLNFHSQRRLLLTGTPLQNNLMELWSLMHFLMPHVFQSHREFKEWFSNPLTGMIEGSLEYNESIVRRLHKVLRPFLLRRLKQDVEKQMPKKYEHVVMCRLSKRQRFLYDDFMSQAKTKETLASGHFMSVINILMQLRKVCNHPDLFDPRPVISPFHMEGISYHIPSAVGRALERNPLDYISYTDIHPNLCDLELSLSSFNTNRIKKLATRRPLIVEIDSLPEPPPRLEPLPDGTQLIVRFPSPSRLDSDQSSTFATTGDENSLAGAHVRSENVSDMMQLDVEEEYFTSAEKGKVIVTDKARKNPLYLESLDIKRRNARKGKLERIHRYNQFRCGFGIVYGEDLRSALDCVSPRRDRLACSNDVGYVQCLNAQYQYGGSGLNRSWETTAHLGQIVLAPEQYMVKLKDMLDRFVFINPPVIAPRLTMHMSHPSPSVRNQQAMEDFVLQKELSPRMACFHDIMTNQWVQFPELRLIQYDCGKLQTMDILLRRLKTGGHRALIFTQMTRMLDVLEAFLNFHGHRYLRLDGTTKVEQRQALMERFNMDQRIFCFILSTRSGGIGVNLTGADTVIFYDSDWNPTMDAQAQDRCHRIGQTRDVHIYRLISERTVEENILKKANEKRLLGNVAIEGGNFTTAFFRQQTIKDLFEEPSGLESLVSEDKPAEDKPSEEVPAPENGLNEELIEQALCAAEDETDIQAVKVARAEQKAELAEFDENQPWDEVKTDVDVKKESEEPSSSNVEIELALLEKDLTPVERYAVSFMETQLAPITNEELMKAEEEVGLVKEEWELSHLKAMKEEEERRAELEEDEMLYTSLTSLNYQAWQQLPRAKTLDDSDSPVKRRKMKSAGRVSNEMKREAIARTNDRKREASPSDSWDDSMLSANIDDSRLSSSSISTNSSSLLGSVDKSASVAKRPLKRPKIGGSATVKVVKANSASKDSELDPIESLKGTKETKKRMGRPPKRNLECSTDEDRLLKKQKKQKLNSDFQEVVSMPTPELESTVPIPDKIPVATVSANPKSQELRQMSVTKLLDSKRFLTAPMQRIIVQRVASEANDEISTTASQSFSKPTIAATVAPPMKYQFENKPTPILEKLSAAVMTSSLPAQNFSSRVVSTAVSKTTMNVLPSHLHVSRLNQIVSSIAQNTHQNVTLSAQSPPGTVQYIIRSGGMVNSGIRTDSVILTSTGVQQPTIAQGGQATSYVIVPQSIGKPSRLIVPSVASQSNKQSVLILPNPAKQNYIVTQQAGNRPGYYLIPNSIVQPNFILTAAASSSDGLTPVSQISSSSLASASFTQASAAGSKVVISSSFPLLQSQQASAARQLVSSGLGSHHAGKQQAVSVQAGLSNTVPILEKLAMQLRASGITTLPQQQHQIRARIVPNATVVQPSPKPAELVYPLRIGQTIGSVIKRPCGITIGQPSSATLSPRNPGAVVTGKMGGNLLARQPAITVLSNQQLHSSASGSFAARLPSAPTLSGQSPGIVLASSKTIPQMNVAQLLVNQSGSHISVDKLTQLAVNGQLVLVDGQELVTSRSSGQQK